MFIVESMEKEIKIFDEYSVSSDGTKITIKAKPVFNGIEKVGYYFIYLIPAIVIYYTPFHSPTLQIWGTILLKVALMAIIFILTKPLIKRLFFKALFVIDREKNTLKSELDNDTFALSEVKEIAIIEDQLKKSDEKFYKLQFHLSEGEKASPFAFTTYNHVKEILDVIKDKASTHA
jgi:hypothetical protein